VKPVFRVPDGCLGDLSGTYVHALNPSVTYRGADDGGTLLLTVERSYGDAGVGLTDANPISVSVTRTLNGFVGETRAVLFVASGHACPVEFPTEITGCEDGGLLLKSAVAGAVDVSCRTPLAGHQAAMVEHRLVRTQARPSSDPRAAPPE
jgi:hypothetical protein